MKHITLLLLGFFILPAHSNTAEQLKEQEKFYTNLGHGGSVISALALARATEKCISCWSGNPTSTANRTKTDKTSEVCIKAAGGSRILL